MVKKLSQITHRKIKFKNIHQSAVKTAFRHFDRREKSCNSDKNKRPPAAALCEITVTAIS